MAVITHTISQNWSGGSGAPLSSQVQITGSLEENIATTLTATTVDQLVPFAMSHTAMEEFYLLVDQPVQMNVNAIHSGSPLFTVNLLAGVPYIWYLAGYLPNPFTSDVTVLYFSNAGSVAANLNIRSLRT